MVGVQLRKHIKCCTLLVIITKWIQCPEQCDHRGFWGFFLTITITVIIFRFFYISTLVSRGEGPSQLWQFSSLLWRGRGEPIRDLEDSPLDSPGINQSRMKNLDEKCPTGCDVRSHQGSQYLRVTQETKPCFPRIRGSDGNAINGIWNILSFND